MWINLVKSEQILYTLQITWWIYQALVHNFTLHNKWSFPLGISSVNVIKSAGNLIFCTMSLVTMIITIMILKYSKDVQDKNFMDFYKLHQIQLLCFFNLNVSCNKNFLWCLSVFDCIFDFFCLVFSIEQFSLKFLQLPRNFSSVR